MRLVRLYYKAVWEEYCIGSDVANYLNQETYNLYRGLYRKKLPFRAATPQEIDILLAADVVAGRRHVTLIPKYVVDVLIFDRCDDFEALVTASCQRLDTFPLCEQISTMFSSFRTASPQSAMKTS